MIRYTKEEEKVDACRSHTCKTVNQMILHSGIGGDLKLTLHLVYLNLDEIECRSYFRHNTAQVLSEAIHDFILSAYEVEELIDFQYCDRIVTILYSNQ